MSPGYDVGGIRRGEINAWFEDCSPKMESGIGGSMCERERDDGYAGRARLGFIYGEENALWGHNSFQVYKGEHQEVTAETRGGAGCQRLTAGRGKTGANPRARAE